MTARRLTRLDVVDCGLVARLAHKYGPQRPAIRWRDARQVAWGCLIAAAAVWVAVEIVAFIQGGTP